MSLRSGASRLRSRTSLSNLIPDPRPRSEWTLLGMFGIVLTGTVFGIVGGLFGSLLTLVFAILWLYVPTVYSYALGHVLALGLSARTMTAVELLFVEMGLVAVLVGPLVTSTDESERATEIHSPRSRSILVAGSGLFSVLVIGFAVADSLWVTAAILVAVAGLAAYGLHRYEQVALGLAAGEDGGETE